MVRAIDSFKRTTLSLHSEDYEVLRFLAFKRKTSIAGLVRELIQELLEDEELAILLEEVRIIISSLFLVAYYVKVEDHGSIQL